MIDLEKLALLESAATVGPWQSCGCGKCGLVWSLPLDTTVGNASGQPEKDPEVQQMSAAQQSKNAELIAELRNECASIIAELHAARELAQSIRGSVDNHGELWIYAEQLEALEKYEAARDGSGK